MSRPVHRPWSAQVELVEGCTRLCSFCGLNAIRDAPGDFKRMSHRTAARTASGLAQLNPTARVEFAMHGEPTAHHDGPGIVAVFRAALPKAQLMLTTNGARFKSKRTVQAAVEGWFRAGLNFIVVDTYADDRDQLLEALGTLRSPVKVRHFYGDLAEEGWNPYHNHGHRERGLVVVMDDIGERDGEHSSRVIMNHAGSNPERPAPASPLPKTCTNPFREVTVTWNGEVRICCMDWRGEYVCGNVNEEHLVDIWYGARFTAARRVLQSKDRRFAPCAFCDKNSGMRVGLLPTMEPPGPEDWRLVEEVTGRPAGDRWHPKKKLEVLK